MDKEIIIKKIKQQYPHLISEYGIKRIGLFGSYARNAQTDDSDIDIIAEFDKPIGLKFVEFTEYLENFLGKKTDVLTPDGVKGITVKRVAEDIQKSVIYV